MNVREQEGVPFLKSLKGNGIEVIHNDVPCFYGIPSLQHREFCKASVVHPEEGKVVISKEPFLHFFSVPIQRISHDVKVAANLVEVSAVLNKVELCA
jgi:hypothetical protein